MEQRQYTQIGTFSIAIFVPVLLILIFVLVNTGISLDSESSGLQALTLLMILCLLTFYKLTIRIEENSLSFKFGIGWFGKSYEYSQIKSCEPVKNPVIAGIGLRWIGNGWLYNVSGLKAIELTFKNKKNVVRIGTDKPEEIAEIIQEKLNR